MLHALSKIPLNPTGLKLQPKFCKEFSAEFWLQNLQFCKKNLYEQSPPLICACSFLHLNSICFNPINLITHWWTCYQELASRFFVKWVEGYHKLEFLTHFCREGGKKNTGTILSVSSQPVVKMRKKEWTKFFAGTSVTHGDDVPAIGEGDELPPSEEPENRKELPLQILFAIFLMGLPPVGW